MRYNVQFDRSLDRWVVIDTVVADVRVFEDGAPQADDITCVALHIRS